MKARTLLYNLRLVNDKPILSIDLTGKIISEHTDLLIVDLPTGVSEIKKRDYLNKMKIYTVDEKLFFLICTKSVSRESAFNCLLKHAMGKIENRIQKLETLKKQYQLQVA